MIQYIEGADSCGKATHASPLSLYIYYRVYIRCGLVWSGNTRTTYTHAHPHYTFPSLSQRHIRHDFVYIFFIIIVFIFFLMFLLLYLSLSQRHVRQDFIQLFLLLCLSLSHCLCLSLSFTLVTNFCIFFILKIYYIYIRDK